MSQTIDEEKVSDMINTMLNTAKQSKGDNSMNDQTIYHVTIALLFSGLSYYLLKTYQPSFVLVNTENNTKRYSPERVFFISLLVGILIFMVLNH